MRRLSVLVGSVAALAAASLVGAGFAHAAGCTESCQDKYLVRAGGSYSTAWGGSINGYVLNVPLPPLPHHPGPDASVSFGVGAGTGGLVVRAGSGDKGYVLNVPLPPLPHHPAVDRAIATVQSLTNVAVVRDGKGGGLPGGL